MKSGFSRFANNFVEDDDARSIDTQSEQFDKSQNSNSSKAKTDQHQEDQEPVIQQQIPITSPDLEGMSEMQRIRYMMERKQKSTVQ